MTQRFGDRPQFQPITIISPRALGLIMGSRVDTLGNKPNLRVIFSNYHTDIRKYFPSLVYLRTFKLVSFDIPTRGKYIQISGQ